MIVTMSKIMKEDNLIISAKESNKLIVKVNLHSTSKSILIS